MLKGYIAFTSLQQSTIQPSTIAITGQYSNCKRKGGRNLKGLRGIAVSRTIPSTQGRYTITAFTPFGLYENQAPVIDVQTQNTSGSIVAANVVSTSFAFLPNNTDYEYQITILLETQSVCGSCTFVDPAIVMVSIAWASADC
jgi:hypothetical protein